MVRLMPHPPLKKGRYGFVKVVLDDSDPFLRKSSLAPGVADSHGHDRYRLAASVTDGHPSRRNQARDRRSDRPRAEHKNALEFCSFTAHEKNHGNLN